LNNKDRMIIQKIISYCEQVEHSHTIFGKTYEVFAENVTYQNACCMCILQIGELAGKLSEEARAAADDIPWREIRGLRNLCAHNYGNIDIAMVWNTLLYDIPELVQRLRQLSEPNFHNKA